MFFLGSCRSTRLSTTGKPQFMTGPKNRWARAAVGSGRPWTSCLSRFTHSLCPEPRPPNYPLIYPKYPQVRSIRTLPTRTIKGHRHSIEGPYRDSIQGRLGGSWKGLRRVWDASAPKMCPKGLHLEPQAPSQGSYTPSEVIVTYGELTGFIIGFIWFVLGFELGAVMGRDA